MLLIHARRWLVIITYIICSDCSCRIPRNQLDLHAEVAKQVGALGLEPSSSVLIKVELDLIAPIEVLDVVKSPSGHIVLAEWDING